MIQPPQQFRHGGIRHQDIDRPAPRLCASPDRIAVAGLNDGSPAVDGSDRSVGFGHQRHGTVELRSVVKKFQVLVKFLLSLMDSVRAAR
jgi:hypothetical protein